MKHLSKQSRYKICFQTKNKVWVYKNSRLRNFYKLRSKIILQRGRSARKFLITKNMKWTVARRQMIPYFRKKSRFCYFYKNLFFTKQQLKNFYGNLKEYQLRNIFKKTWNKEHFYRCNVFLGSLEQRLSMILFRVRLLPTIFSCIQLIKHQGILVNNQLITLANYRVKIGDIISISRPQWFLFYKFLFERLQNRFFGHALLLWRKQYLLKRITFYRLKKKQVYLFNLRLFKKYAIEKKRFKRIKKIFRLEIKKFKKKKNRHPFAKKNRFFLRSLYILFIKTFFFKLKNIGKRLQYLRSWNTNLYFKRVNFLIFRLFALKFLLSKFLTLAFQGFLIRLHICRREYQEKRRRKIGKFSQPNKKKKLDEYLLNTWTRWQLCLYRAIKGNFISSQAKYNILKIKLQKYFLKRFKKTKILKNNYNKYKRYFRYLLRKLKYKRRKKKLFKNWCRKPHWYIPQYLEVDFNTLRISFIYYPQINEVHYGFLSSFQRIISFYKQRAL